MLGFVSVATDALFFLQAVGTEPRFRWNLWRPLVYSLSLNGFPPAVVAAAGIWGVGEWLERRLGTENFLIVFMAAGVGAATAHTLAGTRAAFCGVMMALVGLLAAFAVVRHREGRIIRGHIMMISLFIAGDALVGFGWWLGHVGAVVVSVILTQVMLTARRRWVTRLTALGVVVACLAVICLRWAGVV